jgi:hypothetical protein
MGVPLHFHYCRGELKHVTFLVKMYCHMPENADAPTGCCKKKTQQCAVGVVLQDCCDDATQWLQENLPAVCIKSNVSDLQGCDPAFVTGMSFGQLTVDNAIAVSTFEAIPPDTPLYLLQCALIYYG